MAPLSSALPSHCLPRDPGGRGDLRRSGAAVKDGEGLLRNWDGGKCRRTRGRRGKLGEGVEARDVVDMEDFKEMPWEPCLEEEGDL